MALLHEEDIKIERRNKTQRTPTGEFIIVAKFGGPVLRHLASRLANVIRQGERHAKNLVLAIFKKIRTYASIIVTLFYAQYLDLVMFKQFNKGTFCHIMCL